MRYLITGGCGFLGSNLADEVLNRDGELFILDDLSRKGSEENLDWLKSKGDLTFYKEDIRSKENVSKVVRDVNPDVIFHLAGQVAMTTSIENPRLDFEINALGTFNLLEAVREHDSESLVVYSSTNKVYGDLEWVEYREEDSRYVGVGYENGFDENTPLEFHSPYGCSKGAADQYMLDYARIFDINTVVLRHSTMYGGRQFATYDQGWIGWFCQKAIETKMGLLKEPFTISGTGKQVRDVLHSNDIKSLYFGLVENKQLVKGEVFNIGGGVKNSLSLLELFSLLENKLNIKLDYKKIEERESDQKVFIADLGKIKKIIQWEPKVDKSKGLDMMLDWLSSEN